jgi:hypothetical protein
MRCSIAILFTCMLVLSCPVGKGGCTCETWNSGTNNKILGGSRQTRKVHVGEGWHEVQSDPRTRPWQTYLRGAPRRQPLKYVWSIWDVTDAKRRKGNWSVMRHLHYICPCLIFDLLSVFCIVPIDCLFFRRLKINHDSHVFILEFGTVANTTNNLDGQKQIGGKNKLHCPLFLFFAVKFFQGFLYQLHVTQI